MSDISLSKFLLRFPEMGALAEQNKPLVLACLQEAIRTSRSDATDVESLVYVTCSALIAESPVGRAAKLMGEKGLTSTYHKRLEKLIQIEALGDRFL